MQPALYSRSPLPWLLLLPLAVLAWPGPGAPLLSDPFPHLAGTGWVSLACLPSAVWLLRCGQARPLPGLRPLFLLWAFVTATLWLASPTDPFEARRAWLHLGSGLVLFAGGAQLDSSGRRMLNRGLVILSLLWAARALFDGLENGYAGVLGNSGTLSQAALPGAVIGAWYVVSRRGLFWFLGLLAFVLFMAHAGLAPVLAGGLSMLLALLASRFLSPWAQRKEQVRRRLGVLAALSIFSLIGVAGLGASKDGDPGEESIPKLESSAPETGGDLGGVGVRFLIWSTIPSLLADQPLAGVGPGQFQAAYPPYRDAREIEASRGAALNAADSFVNHAHNDVLHGLAEFGLLAGLLWIGFLGLALRASLRALAQTDFPTIASAAGALALLTNSLFHTPLGMNPAAAAIGCTLFGVVCGRHSSQKGLQPTRPWRWALLLIILAGLPSAWGMLRFGSAFSAHVRANQAFIELDQGDGGAELNALYLEALATRKRAIAAAPESAPSRFVAARSAKAEQQLAAWEAVLEVRPHSVEALDHIGVLQARAGQVKAAREAWNRALELSPTQPRLLENLARLEFLEGEPELGLGYLERRLALGPLRTGLDRYFGSQLILRGLWAAGAPLLTGEELPQADPNKINANYQIARKAAPELEADALRCLSQLLWAREHMGSGNHEVALRSYGQALRPTRKLQRNGAPVLRAEIAALKQLAGDSKAAQLEALGLTLSAAEWRGLPEWAQQALQEAQLIERP